jgi:hypothetical protein
MLKLWEENRGMVIANLGKVILGMLNLLFKRMESSIEESEVFILYFEQYIKTWD